MKNRHPFHLGMPSAEAKECLALYWKILVHRLRYWMDYNAPSTLILINKHWNWKAEFKLSSKAVTIKSSVYFMSCFSYLSSSLSCGVVTLGPGNCVSRGTISVWRNWVLFTWVEEIRTACAWEASIFSITPPDQQGHSGQSISACDVEAAVVSLSTQG